MPTHEELWFAAKSTKIVYMPPRLLETFGQTSVNYLVLSELMDRPDQVRLRHGKVSAARPRIITPQYFLKQAISNFGEDARKYFSEVLSSKDSARFIEYGLVFEKQEYSEETVGGQLMEIADQAAKEAQDKISEVKGVLVAVDDTWEVSLLHFITELVKRSAPHNAREMGRRGLLDMSASVPQGLRNEINLDFENCDSLDKARSLAAKLRDHGIFEDFEDRFYELYKQLKR
ncbi:MAG: hypothetical protein PHG44_05965 [Lentisphaeria bacterium]|jgi:hypothetical protein|nr:hypothetical protein [Lentisphaeria bacterium]MDY0176614.1 hypothetical protein [Lentisphaeria bacterium]NLZ60892.1 hypothetical protein [Lentisphaerota bacterium]